MTIESFQPLLTSTVFNSGPIVLYIWKNDKNWPLLAISDNITTHYGYIQSEYINANTYYQDHIHPEDKERFFQELWSASKAEKTTYEHTAYRYLTKAQHYVWVKNQTTILYDYENNITHYIGYITNIDFDIKCQQILNTSDTKWQTIMQKQGNGLWEYTLKK
jgi:hypothetical protein